MSFTADGSMFGLAVDFITGNLYGGNNGSYIFVCSSAMTGPLNCTTILNSRDGIRGIALSPNDGQSFKFLSYAGDGAKLFARVPTSKAE